MKQRIGSKLKSAGIWQSLQTGIQAIVHLSYTAIMARLLSRSDFGLMAIAGGFISLGILFTEAGMGSALIQKKRLTRKHHAAALQGSVLSGLLVFTLFFLASGPIATFFRQPMLADIIKVIGITVLLSSASSISISLLQKHFRFRSISLITTCTTLTGYGIGIILAFRGFGIWSLVTASVINALLSSLALVILAPVIVSFRFHTKEFRELFAFGSGMMILRFNNYLGAQGLNLMLGKFFMPAQLGLFERSNQIKNIPAGYLGNVLDSIMFPAMAEVQNDRRKLFSIYQNAVGITQTFLIPVTIYLIFFAKEIVLILLGSQWLDAVLPLQIMLVVLPFAVSVRLADAALRACGLVYQNVRQKFMYIAILFSTVYTGAHYFGVVGAAIGVTLSFLFNYFTMLRLIGRLFAVHFSKIFWQPITGSFRLTLVMCMVTGIAMSLLLPWHPDPILKFLVVSACTGSVVLLAVFRRPAMLGPYTKALVDQMLTRKNPQQVADLTITPMPESVPYQKTAS